MRGRCSRTGLRSLQTESDTKNTKAAKSNEHYDMYVHVLVILTVCYSE